MNKLFIKTLFICLVSCNISLSGTIDPQVSDEKYIEYGKKHQCVVELGGIEKNSGKNFMASAVVVRPKIIITAAHILSEAEKETSFIILDTQEKIKLSAYIYPAAYNKEIFASKDIAIGYLEKEAKLDFYPELYDKDDEIGKVCSIAGFGITGNHIKGTEKYDGKKRAGSNIIDEIMTELLICSVSNEKKTSLEFLIASGDSGGGLFIDKKLAGINSCVLADDGSLDSNYKDWSGHIRVSIHRLWIEEVIKILEEIDAEKLQTQD